MGTTGGVKLVLEVVQGPSVDFRVTDRVCDDGVGSFQHHQQCGHGKCLVDISTEALYSGSDVFYIVITSGEIDFGRHTNVLGEKDTVYSLSLQTGGSACASRPSSGFCGASALDVDDAFTSGAFDISQSTWDYEFPEDRDEMARWRYESFIATRCPSPTDNCKRWLRRIAHAGLPPHWTGYARHGVHVRDPGDSALLRGWRLGHRRPDRHKRDQRKRHLGRGVRL